MNKRNMLITGLFSTCLLLSCSSEHQDEPEELSLNNLQIIGSHNSYKRALNPEILTLVAKTNAKKVAQINYSHPSLNKQLQLGLRHFEIDIVKDPTGGRFSFPEGERITQQTIITSKERELLGKPGFKVMHLPDIDFSSHCILFQGCLDELIAFSKKEPDHLPIVVLMNLKESGTKLPNATEVLPFEASDYVQLDEVLLKTFGKKLITPSEIKGKYTTLEQAVLNKGWPTLHDSRGRFLFVLDGKPAQLEMYRNGYESLQGRSMFASYEEGQAEAALMIRNNPVKKIDDIKQLVNKGYLVRTRADSGAGTLSKTKDVKFRTEHAIKSGAQIISTDFYLGAPQSLPSGFVVSFKQGMLYRCNQKVGEALCKLGN